MDFIRLKEELNKYGIGDLKLVFYGLTDSTNTRAREYAKENGEDRAPVLFVANGQTRGRGRRGRSFISNSGSGIYMSLLIYPDRDDSDTTSVTARAAVALARATEMLCPCRTSIKWVNDIYLGGKKLAGILTEGEMTAEGKIDFYIVGMGINVYKNAISEEIKDIATSIEGEGFAPPSRSELVAATVRELLYGATDCYEEYRSRSMVIGKRVQVLKLVEQYEARAIDINPDYSLEIERNGRRERLFTGEISLKI